MSKTYYIEGAVLDGFKARHKGKKKDGRWATSPIFISLMFSFSSLMSSSLFLGGGGGGRERERGGGHSGLPGSPDWLQMMNGIVYIFCGIRLLLIWQSWVPLFFVIYIKRNDKDTVGITVTVWKRNTLWVVASDSLQFVNNHSVWRALTQSKVSRHWRQFLVLRVYRLFSWETFYHLIGSLVVNMSRFGFVHIHALWALSDADMTRREEVNCKTKWL